jgi:hypothetical protein
MPSRTRTYVALATALAMSSSSLAHADGLATPLGTAGTTASPSAAARAGVAVLARPGAEASGWALAKAVYARDALRPATLDEVSARVLVGYPAPPESVRATRDLADERAAIHGDDGASRALLSTIASQLGVRAVIVVETVPLRGPSARVFLADTQSFDAAQYVPDAPPAPLSTPASSSPSVTADGGAPSAAASASDGGMNASSVAGSAPLAPSAPPPPPTPPAEWSGAVASLERTFTVPVLVHEGATAPALAFSPLPPEAPKKEGSHPFYTSPWFWGAVGAAVFGGTAVYFATRDNSSSTIHLELQVPK